MKDGKIAIDMTGIVEAIQDNFPEPCDSCEYFRDRMMVSRRPIATIRFWADIDCLKFGHDLNEINKRRIPDCTGYKKKEIIHEDEILVTDHLGRGFRSTKEMCNHWNMNVGVYYRRIDLGFSVKDALTKPLEHSKLEVEDHKGNKFDSVEEMCNVYGIAKKLYEKRVNERHLSVEDALTMLISKEEEKELASCEENDVKTKEKSKKEKDWNEFRWKQD